MEEIIHQLQSALQQSKDAPLNREEGIDHPLDLKCVCDHNKRLLKGRK